MSNIQKRINELYEKMHRTGLGRDERVELTALEARAEVAKLQQVEVDKVKAELWQENIETQKIRAETARLYAETSLELGLLEIYRTPFDGRRLAQNEANKTILVSWLNLDEIPSAEWLSKIFTERPSVKNDLIWERPAPSKHEQKLQEQADRETFSRVCRKNDVAEIEANFRLLVDVLGSGFSEFSAANAIQSNAVQLSPATPQELTKWHEEQVEQRNFDLYRTDISTLKKLTRAEAEQRRVATVQADAARVVREKELTEAGQFEPLPATTHDGKTIDKKFFLQCDRQTMKYYIQRYGDFQVTRRIRGL
jgi:hypothetical protein